MSDLHTIQQTQGVGDFGMGCCQFCKAGDPRPIDAGEDWPCALAVRLQALHPGLKVFMQRNEESGCVEVTGLVVPPNRRRRGLATQVMLGICWHADQNGDTLLGTPEPIRVGKHAMTGPQLKRWYRQRFGFVPNRERRVDFSTRHTFRRPPAL